MAALIGELFALERTDPLRVTHFRRWLEHARVDLSGGRQVISSPRHAHYCDDHALRSALDRAFAKLGTRAEKLLPGAPPALPARAT
jgi:hypothetical protein